MRVRGHSVSGLTATLEPVNQIDAHLVGKAMAIVMAVEAFVLGRALGVEPGQVRAQESRICGKGGE